MKPSKNRNTFENPFLIWADLALTTGEMMLASAQVIGHRATRMAAAGPNPSARDRREFALMGQEKMEAAAESAQAMVAQMMQTNQQLGARAFKHMLTAATALMSLAASRTAGQSITRQSRLVRVMTDSAATASQFSSSAGRLAQHALRPIHSRATANAKRLGKHRIGR